LVLLISLLVLSVLFTFNGLFIHNKSLPHKNRIECACRKKQTPTNKQNKPNQTKPKTKTKQKQKQTKTQQITQN